MRIGARSGYGMILNYYELLNVGAHATEQQIEAAYREKIMKCDSDLMKQRYDTAYYHLTDGKRRYEYDRSLGIHRYKKHGVFYRFMIGLIRGVLTILDALMTFYWCFLIVVVCCSICDIVYPVLTSGAVSLSAVVSVAAEFAGKYVDEIYILSILALMDLAGHFYVRRANRYLKHAREVSYEEYTKQEKGSD